MHRLFIRFVASTLLLTTAIGCRNSGTEVSRTNKSTTRTDTTFTNPLLKSGPDPWVFRKDGYYYYMHTVGNRLMLWKTKTLSQLSTAGSKTIWTPPATGPNSHDIWAPEIHFLNGKWYVYYAADDGKNDNHRLWVLENASPDPMEGTWTNKGKLTEPGDKWAIDGSVFEKYGQAYIVWSGWEGNVNGRQDIYLARLKNPWTIDGKRVMLSKPQYDWEKSGDPDVNEGPEILKHDGKTFLVYSASGCWTDDYALGMLTASDTSDLMDPASWTKSSTPVFTKLPEGGVYGPGHNSFFQSPDGTEDWMLYHANPQSEQGCGDRRSPRAQKFSWNSDGAPNFGRPVAIGAAIQKPSGE